MSGLHCSAGAVDDGAAAGSHNWTQHDLAQALDGGAVEAHDGGSGSNLLALDGELLEAFTF